MYQYVLAFYLDFILIDMCCLVMLGYGVVIVKNGHRICGSGGCLANAPIAQNKAYFEAKLQSSGTPNSAINYLFLVQ